MSCYAPYDEDVIKAADNLMHLCRQGRDEFNWDDCECCGDYRTCKVLATMDELQFMD